MPSPSHFTILILMVVFSCINSSSSFCTAFEYSPLLSTGAKSITNRQEYENHRILNLPTTLTLTDNCTHIHDCRRYNEVFGHQSYILMLYCFYITVINKKNFRCRVRFLRINTHCSIPHLGIQCQT